MAGCNCRTRKNGARTFTAKPSTATFTFGFVDGGLASRFRATGYLP